MSDKGNPNTILDFLRVNPRSTPREVSDGTGIGLLTARTELYRLAQAQRIQAVGKAPGRGGQYMYQINQRTPWHQFCFGVAA